MQANRSARSPRPVSVCSFTFADGRQCRLPRLTGHPYLCLFHAKKEAQILSGEQAGQDIANFLSGNYISACDVAKSLARLFSAVAQGHIKPKTAATLAYLGQTLVQTLKLAQDEYINAFGTPAWRQTIASSFPLSPSTRPPTTPRNGGSLDPSPDPQPPRPSSPSPAPLSPPASRHNGGSLDPSPNPSTAPKSAPPHTAPPQPTPAARGEGSGRGTIHRALFAPSRHHSRPLAPPSHSACRQEQRPVARPHRRSAGGAAQASPTPQRWRSRRTRPQHRRRNTGSSLCPGRPTPNFAPSNPCRINTYKSV